MYKGRTFLHTDRSGEHKRNSHSNTRLRFSDNFRRTHNFKIKSLLQTGQKIERGKRERRRKREEREEARDCLRFTVSKESCFCLSVRRLGKSKPQFLFFFLFLLVLCCLLCPLSLFFFTFLLLAFSTLV